MSIPIPSEAAAALVAAGSASIAPSARAEVAARIARWGVCPAARNIGGIACGMPGPHKLHTRDGAPLCVPWRGRMVEAYPSYADAAERLVRLARLATGEGAAGQVSTAGFRSMAPASDASPLAVTHTDGAESSALLGVLAGHVGGDLRAREMVGSWAAARPDQRAALRAQLDAEERAAGRPAGAPSGADLLDQLAGVSAESDTGAAKKKKKKQKPTPKAVLAAQATAKQAQAQAKAALAAQAALRQQLQQAQAQAQAQAAEQQAQAAEQQAQAAEQQAQAAEQQGEPRTIAPPTGEAAQLAERVAALEQELTQATRAAEAADAAAEELQGHADDLAGLFGPSDAAARAFQDLAAGWTAVEMVQFGAADNQVNHHKIPGWDAARAAWIEFQRAWKAGDATSQQCNGDCESGLNAQIMTLRTIQTELSKAAPSWADQLKPPAGVGLEQLKPIAATVDSAAAMVPILGPLTRHGGPIAAAVTHADSLAKGSAPKWHYIAWLGALGALGAVALRAAFPRARR